MNKKETDERTDIRRRKFWNDVSFWMIVIVFLIVMIYLFVTGRAFE